MVSENTMDRALASAALMAAASTRSVEAARHPQSDARVSGSWPIRLWPVGHWAIPRFYVRYPNGFVFFEPADVEAVAREWGDPDFMGGVLGVLPLSEPHDLYRFTLMGRPPRAASPQVERFVSNSLLAGRAVVLARSGYLESINVTRTLSGELRFWFGEDEATTLLSTRVR